MTRTEKKQLQTQLKEAMLGSFTNFASIEDVQTFVCEFFEALPQRSLFLDPMADLVGALAQINGDPEHEWFMGTPEMKRLEARIRETFPFLIAA
jgi:hypothetical protein